jgi:hypothetical protein
MPTRGEKKNYARVEVPVDLPGWDDGKATETRPKRKPGWIIKPRLRTWVHRANINEVGDYMYHGLKLEEIVKARAEEKAADLAKTAKRVKRLKG